MAKILIFDYCNYVDYQIGGHLSFAKSMMSAFGNELSLIGITTEKEEPLGKWFKKTLNGITYSYFALARYDKLKTKHLIPDRLACYFLVLYYRKRILKLPFKNVFIQRHEILPAITKYHYENICYCYPGMENPLHLSKYGYAKYLSGFFEKLIFKNLENAKVVIANGDDQAIAAMEERSKGIIPKNTIVKFPVRINTRTFCNIPLEDARKELNFPINVKLVVTAGRLAWIKGWDFMIDAFRLFSQKHPAARLIMIGDGEDMPNIINYLNELGLTDKVTLAGGKTPDEVALYLNAADVYIMGSHKEGWSTSLSEAISCGVPSCVTNFSSAKDIIKEGVNGYVVDSRDPESFAGAMEKALRLPRPVFNEHVRTLSTDTMKDDLLKIWKLV